MATYPQLNNKGCHEYDCKIKLLSQGLKTGMYYLRTKPAAKPIQFTLDKERLKDAQADTTPSEEETKSENTAAMVCSLANKDDCLMCGS